jgi:Cu/Ag efflux protein CusF
MRISRHTLLSLVLAASMPALAQSTATGQPKRYTKESTKTYRATVDAVDQDTRTVTLKGADGDSRTFQVGPEVRNLKQVKVGDEVILQYKEALAIEVKKPEPGTPLTPPTASEATTRAEPGKKPAASVARGYTATATVTAIDKAAQTVTLKGPKGNTVVLKVKDPKKLEGVNIGDTVTAEYTEAMAVAVQPAGPGKMPSQTPAPAKK